MKTYKTVTVNNYFFGVCERIVLEHNRGLSIDFHNYISEMHSRLIKNKSNYGFFSNDRIKRLEVKDFTEFRRKLWDCGSVYYYSKYLDTGIKPSEEELNKIFWLDKDLLTMIHEINDFKKTTVFDPDYRIMEVINSPY